MLGYCQFDLSQYVGKNKEVVEMELTKPKIAKSYVQFKLTILHPNQLEDLDTFNKTLKM